MSEAKDRADNQTQNQQRVTKGVSIHRKFRLKHVFRGGAVIWTKSQGKDYYLVFTSKTRPNRGIQLPGGRIERNENMAEAIIREVKEETGVSTKIICPLGIIYFDNEDDNYSSLQIYYLVRPLNPIKVNRRWKFTDRDQTHQELECWFEPVDKPADFLAAGQQQAVEMFRQWLSEHKKPEIKAEEIEKQINSEIFDSDRDIFEL